MWKLGHGVFQTFLVISICSSFIPIESEGAPVLYPPYEMDYSNYDHLLTLLREYIKLIERVQNQHKHISGQMSSRTPRSDLIGELSNSQRLHQLQELDRMYGAKSRPRFGKRIWLNQDEGQVFGYNDAANNINIPVTNEGDQNRRKEIPYTYSGGSSKCPNKNSAKFKVHHDS